MRTSVLGAVLATALVLLGVPAAAGHPGGAVTDDPSGPAHRTACSTAPACSSAEPFLGGQEPASAAQKRARDVSLVGALKLDPFNLGVHGDVAGWKDLAFVGKWREACPGTGVDIIDIKRPKKPVKIADTLDYADTSMEDMQVMKIRGRDILGIGLQDCGNSATEGTVGLELYDITNPRNPQLPQPLQRRGLRDGGRARPRPRARPDEDARRPDARAALVAGPRGADVEPAALRRRHRRSAHRRHHRPVEPDAPQPLGRPPGARAGPRRLPERPGGRGRADARPQRAGQQGRHARLRLLLGRGLHHPRHQRPGRPVFLGRTAYAPGEEGNAHSVDESPSGEILAAADEDFSPFELRFTSSAFAGLRGRVRGRLHGADRDALRPRDGRRGRPRRARLPGGPGARAARRGSVSRRPGGQDRAHRARRLPLRQQGRQGAARRRDRRDRLQQRGERRDPVPDGREQPGRARLT